MIGNKGPVNPVPINLFKPEKMPPENTLRKEIILFKNIFPNNFHKLAKQVNGFVDHQKDYSRMDESAISYTVTYPC
jgi:hypothetical protein